MESPSRAAILAKLKAARKGKTPPRPDMPPLKEMALDQEAMIARFSEELAAQTGVVHRVADAPAALAKLAEIAGEEGLKRVLASSDDVLSPLGLKDWGAEHGVEVLAAADFAAFDDFKDAAFSVDAGITGADFAVAETGTIGLIFNQDQPRLNSIAPPLHIVIIPTERFCHVYEEAIEKVFANGEKLPSQFAFITGPSMTADIQATPFKGMHGPRRLMAILVG